MITYNQILRLLKRVARGLMPTVYEKCRRYSRYSRLVHRIVCRQGLIVASGPFGGMHYIQESCGSQLIPKLLGSYECELHNAIYEVILTQPRVVVDIGCAEGYYAVGFARLLPDAVVYAYDINRTAREYCTELVKLNGLIGRVIVRGKCDKNELESLPLEGAVIISDCEGYELDLLDPGKVPGLLKAMLIVELHEYFVPGLSNKLLPRFEDTHNILLISSKQRTASCYQSLAGFKPAEQQLALDEMRRIGDKSVQGRWAYMVPKTGCSKP